MTVSPAVPPWDNLMQLILYGFYTHVFLCILALTFPTLKREIGFLNHPKLIMVGEIEKYLEANFAIAVFRMLIAAIICLSYVYSTYAGYISRSLLIFNRIIGMTFLPYFFIKFLYFPRPFQAVFHFYTLVEIFSLASLIFAKSTDWLNFSFLQAYIALGCYFQIEHAIYSISFLKTTPLNRQLIRMFLQFAVFIFVFASGLQLCEQMDDPWDVFNRYTFDLTFHNSLYFTVVTIFTVGYGDFVPFTLLGRLWIIFIIIFGAVLVTRTIGQVMDVVSSLKRGLRSFVKSETVKHCVICGNVKWEYLKPFVQEFYSYQKNMGKKLIVMCSNPNWTEDVWNSFYDSDRRFRDNLIYLEGACLSKDDLIRAQVETAEAVFVLSNQHNPDPYSEDSQTLKRILTLRSYAPNKPIYPMCALRESMLQIEYALEHIENEAEQEGLSRHPTQSHSEYLQLHHRSEAIEDIRALHDFDHDHIHDDYHHPTHQDFSDDEDDNDSVQDNGYDGSSDVKSDAICMQEVEMFLMAENVFCNGLSTLLANLILRAYPQENEGDPSWLLEYKTGAECKFELVQLPPGLHKKKVRDIALVMYDYGIILVATKKSSYPWRPVTPETEINLSSIGLIITFIGPEDLQKRMEQISAHFQDLSPETSQELRSLEEASSIPRDVPRHTLAGDMLTGDVSMTYEYSADEWIVPQSSPYYADDIPDMEGDDEFLIDQPQSLTRHSSLPSSDAGHLDLPFNQTPVGSMQTRDFDESPIPPHPFSAPPPRNNSSDEVTDDIEDSDNNILASLSKRSDNEGIIEEFQVPRVIRGAIMNDESDEDFWSGERAQETVAGIIRRNTASSNENEQNIDSIPAHSPTQPGSSIVHAEMDKTDKDSNEGEKQKEQSRIQKTKRKSKDHHVSFPIQADPKKKSDSQLQVYSGYGDELPIKMKGHVVACVIGKMAFLNLKHFLERIWTKRPPQGDPTTVVAICADLREEDEAELLSGLPPNKLILLQGNSLSVETLRKAQYQSSRAVVILACEDPSNADHIDAKAIFTVMTLDHLLAERSQTFVCSMLNAEESMQLLRAPDRPRRRGANLTSSADEFIEYRVPNDRTRRSASRVRSMKKIDPSTTGSTRHSFAQRTLSINDDFTRAASHGGLSRLGSRSLRGMNGVFAFPNTNSFVDQIATRTSSSFHPFSGRMDDSRFYPELSFGGPSRLTFMMDRTQSRLGPNLMIDYSSKEKFPIHSMKARDECLEKQRYASGELLISSAYVSLLISELQMPGLLDILREVFGGGFGKVTNSRQCWIRTVRIPKRWIAAGENEQRIFREVFDVLLHHGAVVLGLYRAGDAPVRVADKERTSEANQRHDDDTFETTDNEGSDIPYSIGMSTPESYIVDNIYASRGLSGEAGTFEMGGDSVTPSDVAWSGDRVPLLRDLPNYGAMQARPSIQDELLVGSDQNRISDDGSDSRNRLTLPPDIFVNTGKNIPVEQSEDEQVEPEVEEEDQDEEEEDQLEEEIEDMEEDEEETKQLFEYYCPSTNHCTIYEERSGKENVLPYVYTSPEAFTLVSRNDAVYVLIPPGTQLPDEW